MARTVSATEIPNSFKHLHHTLYWREAMREVVDTSEG